MLDITSEDDARGDLVAGRYDAGIHLGEFLDRDMTAVRVTRNNARPSWPHRVFRHASRPKTPTQLTAHRCLQYSHGHRWSVYRWEFEKRGKALTVSDSGPVIVSDAQFMIRAALAGVGSGLHPGRLRGRAHRARRVWCGTGGPVSALRRLLPLLPEPPDQSPALQALVDTLRV